MTDAPSVAPQVQPARTSTDADPGHVQSVSYLCQKCHWRKLNAPDELGERERSISVLPEPQQLPLRSPSIQTFVAPPPPQPAIGGPWVPQPQPPPLPTWHNSVQLPGPVAHAPPPIAMHNGLGHPPLAPINHPPPFHAPYNPVHQTNGYSSYSTPPMHSQIPPAPLRGPYAPSHPPINGPPPPLHLTNGGIMVNGMHSPRVPYSPTHPLGHNSSRAAEGPFSGPSQSSFPPMHHSSPAPGRPSTPRDAPVRDIAMAPLPPERASTGASASPSLRNLIH